MPGFPWEHNEAGNLSAATADLFLCIQGWEQESWRASGQEGGGTAWQAECGCLWMARGLLSDLDQVSFHVPTLGHSSKSVQVNERQAAQAEPSLNLQHGC